MTAWPSSSIALPQGVSDRVVEVAGRLSRLRSSSFVVDTRGGWGSGRSEQGPSEDTDGGDDINTACNKPRSGLITSAAAWRKEFAKWQQEMADADGVSDEDGPEAQEPSAAAIKRAKSLFPRSLALLFGGKAARPADIPPAATRRKAFTEERLYMELLAAEHADEEPDDGAKDGSEDDYED
ncbi:hypothetical protein AURDEDRAFT_170564 [Auricularia subglabra TFB-10046 SS5]|nr:hypothetical protein AURDEDRAFT_170564 [Auricularia subglabra TFB-10046 SS5]